ncbi:MAG: HPr family phosphocarrier protein [Lachnospirales bacterium]
MVKKSITVGNNMGDRPIPTLVATAGKFASSIHLQMDEKTINLKSIMGVISIGNLFGNNVTITAEGKDEEEACKTIVDFLS